MTSRINAHTTCPGCREEVYLDELVKGRCPLCGSDVGDFDEQENELDEFFDRSDLPWLIFHYFLFKRFLEMGASPLQVMQLANEYSDRISQEKPDTRFMLAVPMTRVDRIRPKRCAGCGKLYLSGGKKVVSGDLSAPGFRFLFFCPEC
jgi:hypothetical protein